MELLTIALTSIFPFPMAFIFHLSSQPPRGRSFLRQKMNSFSFHYLNVFTQTLSSFLFLQLISQKSQTLAFPSSLHFYSGNSYPSMALLEQCHAGFTTDIELPIFVNERAYVLEPSLEAERRKFWHRSAFIPYVLVGKVHAFMIPLSKYIKKPQLLLRLLPLISWV